MTDRRIADCRVIRNGDWPLLAHAWLDLRLVTFTVYRTFKWDKEQQMNHRDHLVFSINILRGRFLIRAFRAR